MFEMENLGHLQQRMYPLPEKGGQEKQFRFWNRIHRAETNLRRSTESLGTRLLGSSSYSAFCFQLCGLPCRTVAVAMKAGAGSSESEHRAVKVEKVSFSSQCIQRGAESGGEGESGVQKKNPTLVRK
jgi:hypothetical protein